MCDVCLEIIIPTNCDLLPVIQPPIRSNQTPTSLIVQIMGEILAEICTVFTMRTQGGEGGVELRIKILVRGWWLDGINVTMPDLSETEQSHISYPRSGRHKKRQGAKVYNNFSREHETKVLTL